MPKGTWIREQTNERTAHRVPRLRGPTAAGTRVTWAFMVHSHVAHTTRHVSWVSDRALPDDARCIRAPFPRSSIRAAQPAIWSETWYGPGTRLVPFRRLRCLAHSDGCVPLGAQLLKERRRARVRGPADGRSEAAQDGQDFAGLCGRAHHRGRTGAPVGSRTRFAVHPHPPSTPSNNFGHGGWVWGAWFGLKVRYLLN